MTDCERDKQLIVQQLMRQYRDAVSEGCNPDLVLAQMVYAGWPHGAVEQVRKAVKT